MVLAAPTVAAKPMREKKGRSKADPKLIAAARELRDRWLEHVAIDPHALLAQGGGGKYDLRRALPAPQPEEVSPSPLHLPRLVAA